MTGAEYTELSNDTCILKSFEPRSLKTPFMIFRIDMRLIETL